MSLKVCVAVILATGFASVYCMIMAYLWLVYLQPSLPLVPVALQVCAFFFAALAGKYWNELDYVTEEETEETAK
jgi:hypothetical protein